MLLAYDREADSTGGERGAGPVPMVPAHGVEALPGQRVEPWTCEKTRWQPGILQPGVHWSRGPLPQRTDARDDSGKGLPSRMESDHIGTDTWKAPRGACRTWR